MSEELKGKVVEIVTLLSERSIYGSQPKAHVMQFLEIYNYRDEVFIKCGVRELAKEPKSKAQKAVCKYSYFNMKYISSITLVEEVNQ